MSRSLLSLSLPLSLALAAAPALADDRYFFSLYSEETARYHMFEMETATLELAGTDRGLWFHANDHWSNWWQIRMAPAEGHRLAPGFYPDVGCHFGRLARLELTNNNPACLFFGTSIHGWFAIRQIAFDSQGRISSLESVFKFALGADDAPGDVGTIRYNAYPLFFSLKSARHSRWGLRDETFHGDSSYFWVSGDGANLRFDALIPRESWAFRVKAPTGKRLATGRYLTAAEPTSTKAGLWLGFYEEARDEGAWTRCGIEGRPGPGALEIKKIRYNAAQQVDGIHASFEFRCENSRHGRLEPPLTGEFRINI